MIYNMMITNIEKFFINTFLKITISGIALVLATDILLFPEDAISISIDTLALLASVFAYLIRYKYPTLSVLSWTTIILLAMFYQCLVPINMITSLCTILVVGFVFSVMLKGKGMLAMHGFTFISINAIFIIQFLNIDQRFLQKPNEVVTIAITYSVLYLILTYATGVLKANYDKIHQYMRDSNNQLNLKAKELEAKNEELLQIQSHLSELNSDLEKVVNERTKKIQIQNEILIKYTYTNAHHLRGPVARLLGLASVYKLEYGTNPNFFIEKMVDQAHQIDSVIKQINITLGSSNDEIKKEV